jgi:hypothetical protein
MLKKNFREAPILEILRNFFLRLFNKILPKSINYITVVYNDVNFNERNSLLLNLLCKFLKINTLTVLENKCYFLHFHKVHN